MEVPTPELCPPVVPPPPPPPPPPPKKVIPQPPVLLQSLHQLNLLHRSDKLHDQNGSVSLTMENQWNGMDLTDKAYKQFIQDYRCPAEGDSEEEMCFISCYTPCVPHMQIGPRCGIVALAMASGMLDQPLSPDHIYSTAKQMGFTKQGEMFSVLDMGKLCETLTSHVTKMIDPSTDRRVLIGSLLQGEPILVPYDADKNNQPCLKGGNTAHWAVLSGIFCPVPKRNLVDLQNREDCDILLHNSYSNLWLLQKVNAVTVNELSDIVSDVDILVYGHQGKSRGPGIWRLSDLIASNGNLYETDPVKFASSKEWVVPKGGLAEGLKNQALILKEKIAGLI